MIDGAGEKVLCLSEHELMRVLEDSVCRLLHSCPMQQVPVGEFLRAYAKTCGGCLHLKDFGVGTVIDLIAKIPYLAKVLCLSRQLKHSMFCNSEIVICFICKFAAYGSDVVFLICCAYNIVA